MSIVVVVVEVLVIAVAGVAIVVVFGWGSHCLYQTILASLCTPPPFGHCLFISSSQSHIDQVSKHFKAFLIFSFNDDDDYW